MSFFVLRCFRCGKHQVQEKRDDNIVGLSFKCRSCGASRKLKKKSQFGLSMEARGPYSARQASEACKYLNSLEIPEDDGFVTYGNLE